MLKIRIDIYLFHRFFSRNSRSTNLCGKVHFALRAQRFFLHRPNVEKKNFSTGVVEVFFSSQISTEMFSTFHRCCGENLDCKKSKVQSCTFLASPRKVPKEGDLKGAELIAPAIKAAPLGNPRRALGQRWSTLTSILFGQKVSRLFARSVRLYKIGVLSCTSFLCSLVWRRGFPKGARWRLAPLWPRSLITFLAEQESNITAAGYQRQLLILAVISRMLFFIFSSPFFRATSTLRML